MKLPAGTATISGHLSHSLNTSFGLSAPSCAAVKTWAKASPGRTAGPLKLKTHTKAQTPRMAHPGRGFDEADFGTAPRGPEAAVIAPMEHPAAQARGHGRASPRRC